MIQYPHTSQQRHWACQELAPESWYLIPTTRYPFPNLHDHPAPYTAPKTPLSEDTGLQRAMLMTPATLTPWTLPCEGSQLNNPFPEGPVTPSTPMGLTTSGLNLLTSTSRSSGLPDQKHGMSEEETSKPGATSTSLDPKNPWTSSLPSSKNSETWKYDSMPSHYWRQTNPTWMRSTTLNPFDRFNYDKKSFRGLDYNLPLFPQPMPDSPNYTRWRNPGFYSGLGMSRLIAGAGEGPNEDDKELQPLMEERLQQAIEEIARMC